MGFSPSALTASLTAYLTPLGRQLLVTNTNALITKFALGDSDANYNTTDMLTTGMVPAIGGDIGPNATVSNSSGPYVGIRYPLYVDGLGGNLKSVDPASINVSNITLKNGQTTSSGNNVTLRVIDKADYTTDAYTNLFVSFGLPISAAQISTYSGKTFASGGYSDTALSGFGVSKVLVIGLDNSQYGEVLDGKEMKLQLKYTGGTYTIYSTFQNQGLKLSSMDANYIESSKEAINFGRAVSFLFSDDIMTPNGGDATLSWATGFGAVKPFSVSRKPLFNLQTDSNQGKTGDTAVGIAYLDKGFIVLTHPTLVNSYDSSYSGNSGTSITFNSISTNVVQNITCIADRGKFGTSSNPTWSVGDTVLISELGLYNNLNQLIAYGKFDRHVEKTIDGFASFGIKITV